MVNIPVITRRELNAYFLSPLAYVVLTGFALVHAMLLVPLLQAPIDLDQGVQDVFFVTLSLLIYAMPILTMRLLSEETKSGTIETLMTTPVSDVEVVLGKFTGALVFAVVMFVPVAVELAFLRSFGPMDAGPILAGCLGLFLLTALFIAIGLFCSALTRVQIGAAIINFAVLLGMLLLWRWSGDSSTAFARIAQYISPPWHYVSFVKGIVDTRDLAYFAITTTVFLFLTVKALELRKWR